jgi:hypothetical protein
VEINNYNITGTQLHDGDGDEEPEQKPPQQAIRSTVVGSHHIKDKQHPPQQAAQQPSHNDAHQPPQQDEDEIPLVHSGEGSPIRVENEVSGVERIAGLEKQG